MLPELMIVPRFPSDPDGVLLPERFGRASRHALGASQTNIAFESTAAIDLDFGWSMVADLSLHTAHRHQTAQRNSRRDDDEKSSPFTCKNTIAESLSD